jgi:hypothetical protein
MSEKHKDKVIAALSRCRSFEDVKALGILFHGTCEDLVGDLEGGGYDGVFWTAASPDIAQAYIPKSGVTSWLHAPAACERKDRISPSRNGGWIMDWAFEKAGVTLEDLDVTWNGESAWSWTIPDGWPTEGDLDDYIKSLGYEPDGMGIYTVSLSYSEKTDDGRWKETIKPADWKLQGELVIILPENLDIRDPEWSEDALGYETHNRIVDFAGFADAGHEAFHMSDKLQSDFQGNIPHMSVGILPAGLEKLSWLTIPATRHDGETSTVWRGAETPEFAAFMKSINPEYRTMSDIEKENRRYAVMCDSQRPYDKTILARAKPGCSKETGFWVDTDPDDVWIMDRETAEEIAGNLVFNSPRIVRAEKALGIIEKQREARMEASATPADP